MVKSKSFCQFSPALQIKTEQTGNVAVCLLLMMGFWDSNWNFQKSYFGVIRICQTAKPNRKEHTWILFPSSQPLIMVWGEWGLKLDKILNLVLLPMTFTPSTPERSTACAECAMKCCGLCTWSGLASLSAVPRAAANIVPFAFHITSHFVLTVAVCTLSNHIL